MSLHLEKVIYRTVKVKLYIWDDVVVESDDTNNMRNLKGGNLIQL